MKTKCCDDDGSGGGSDDFGGGADDFGGAAEEDCDGTCLEVCDDATSEFGYDPEDFEGGYLQVFGGDMAETEKTKIRIKRGYAVFFASFLLHRVRPVTEGNRKSLVMWFGGTPLK